jgi:hypothetical protein
MIKSYFNLHFKNKFIHLKGMSLKRRNSLLRRIYVSNIEIKHTNNKAIITLYVINTQKKTLHKRYENSKLFFEFLRLKIENLQKMFFNKKIEILKNRFIKNLMYNGFIFKKSKILNYKFDLLSKIVKYCNLCFNKYIKKNMFNKLKFIRKINLIRGHIYTYRIDRFKFEEVYFLYKLNNLLTKILNKKIEYNIINLKSLTYNTDIFTKALALKLRKKKFFVMRGIYSIINRAKLPKGNTVVERADLRKFKDVNLVHNKFKDGHLLSNLNNNEDFFKFLKNMYNIHDRYLKLYTLRLTTTDQLNPSYSLIAINNNDRLENNLKRSMFNSIKYKNMAGIRLQVKGRLTRRYRADRALYKLK